MRISESGIFIIKGACAFKKSLPCRQAGAIPASPAGGRTLKSAFCLNLLFAFLTSPLPAETTRFEVRAVVAESETDTLLYDVFTQITPEGFQESIKASKEVLLSPSDMDGALVYFKTDGKQPLPHAQWVMDPSREEMELKLANLDTLHLQLEPVVEFRLNERGKKKWRAVLKQNFSEGVAVTGNGLCLAQSSANTLFSGGPLRIRVPGKAPSPQDILRFIQGLELSPVKARPIPRTSTIFKKSNVDQELRTVNG